MKPSMSTKRETLLNICVWLEKALMISVLLGDLHVLHLNMYFLKKKVLHVFLSGCTYDP